VFGLTDDRRSRLTTVSLDALRFRPNTHGKPRRG
jgi:hypothetical protein